MTANTIHPEGTTVRVTALTPCPDADMAKQQAAVGRELTVYAHIPEGDRDNDDPEGKGYVMLDSEGSYGGVYWAYEDEVEVVRTAAQNAARRPPNLKQVQRFLVSQLHGDSNGMEVFETSAEGLDVVECVGKTDEGLPFVFRVEVLSVHEADF